MVALTPALPALVTALAAVTTKAILDRDDNVAGGEGARPLSSPPKIALADWKLNGIEAHR